MGTDALDWLMGSPGLQGIALAIGITAASHMEVVWAMLEQLGRTRFLRSSCTPPDSQVEEVSGDRGAGGLESLACLPEPQFPHWKQRGNPGSDLSLRGCSVGLTPSLSLPWPRRCEPRPRAPSLGPEPPSRLRVQATGPALPLNGVWAWAVSLPVHLGYVERLRFASQPIPGTLLEEPMNCRHSEEGAAWRRGWHGT